MVQACPCVCHKAWSSWLATSGTVGDDFGSKTSPGAAAFRLCSLSLRTSSEERNREVLHGVGADGVGVKFPFFAVNFAVVCPCPLGKKRKPKKKRRKAKKKQENA